MSYSSEWTRNIPSAESVAGSVMDFARDWAHKLPSTDELRRLAGLQARRSAAADIMPSLALFGAGVLVGAVLGLLFAPSSGQELRTEISERASELRERGERTASSSSRP